MKAVEEKKHAMRILLIDVLTYIFLRHIFETNISSANNVLNSLPKLISTSDEKEQSIFIDRIKIVLQPSIERSQKKIKEYADLSRKILQLNSRVGFAILNVGIDILVNKLNYEDAYKEIQKKNCEKERLINCLVYATEFLIDKRPSNKKTEPLINSLFELKDILFSNKNVSPENILQIENTLKTSMKESPLKKIPGIYYSTIVFRQLLRLLEGDNSNIHELIEDISNNTAVPNWIKWAAWRIILLEEKSSLDIINNLNKEESFSSVLPMFLKILCYRESSVIKNKRIDILKSKLYKTNQLLFNLHGWDNDLSQYNMSLCTSFNERWQKKITYIIKGLPTSVKEASKIDIEVSHELYKARQKIIKGAFEEAKDNLQQLLKKISNSCIIIKVWWEPLIIYWVSVAQAHYGNLNEAINGFQSLITGPKGDEASGQLALCLIKKNDLEGAQGILSLSKIQCPSKLYAKALLAWRLNDIELAEKLIEEFKSLFGQEQKHYYNACIRLLALIKETQGAAQNAIESLHFLNDSQSNIDIIAAIRMSRIIVRQAFQDYISSSSDKAIFSSRSELLDSIASLIPNELREHKLKLLFDILADNVLNSNQLSSLQKRSPVNYAWCQLLLTEHIRARNITSAFRLLNQHLETNFKIEMLPNYLMKSVLTVGSYRLLTQTLQSPACNGQKLNVLMNEPIYRFLHQKERAPNRFDYTTEEDIINLLNETLSNGYRNYWKETDYLHGINCANKIAKAVLLSDAKLLESQFDKKSNQLLLIRNIISFSHEDTNPTKEDVSNEIILFCQANQSCYQEIQFDMARLIANWNLKNFDEVLNISESINFGNNIPIVDDHLWLAKAFIWFKNEKFNLIFEKDMPEKIADLSNPNACILMAKASARLAIKSWRRKNNQEALNYIRQATSTLDSLIQINTNESELI